MTILRVLLVLSMAALPACGDDGAAAAPAAPTGLAAAPLTGGAHLTWTDNSDDEVEFMIMRKTGAAGASTTIATVPFDSTAYHDAPLVSGTTYTYMVMAINDIGTTESNEVEFTAP